MEKLKYEYYYIRHADGYISREGDIVIAKVWADSRYIFIAVKPRTFDPMTKYNRRYEHGLYAYDWHYMVAVRMSDGEILHASYHGDTVQQAIDNLPAWTKDPILRAIKLEQHKTERRKHGTAVQHR